MHTNKTEKFCAKVNSPNNVEDKCWMCADKMAYIDHWDTAWFGNKTQCLKWTDEWVKRGEKKTMLEASIE